ncbi:hypothetical protein A0U93_05505 [Neoasaia chiangmaiensis]|uniref:Uncharacterized protein n=1 Tax=Neoasaia chiangmaiensis TaxID=320497 RepID=A0A1U9KNV6_9PROT|nr:hypothetical protein A0U93_05505 [Neoasaia chiangmaiensis]
MRRAPCFISQWTISSICCRQNGHPVIDIHSGPLMKRLLRGMRCAIAAMASQDNDIIVDDVIPIPMTQKSVQSRRRYDIANSR